MTMGGKKGPEKNRKYEKDRRNRFNEQINELNKLLPDPDSSANKVTKADIIGRTIQYLKDVHSRNQKLQADFDNERNKIKELQKKIASLLHVIKELTNLLHKSNITFPSSIPMDELSVFKEDSKNKRKNEKQIESSDEKRKILNDEESVVDEALASESNLNKEKDSKNEEHSDVLKIESPGTNAASSEVVSCSTPSTSSVQIMQSNIVGINSSLILSPRNSVAVNSFPNTFVNNLNPTILLNKPVTVPTLIVMQNNVIPVNDEDLTAIQNVPKPIVPKFPVNTTQTTFINKKPIPAVRLFKSVILSKNRSSSPVMKCRRVRRSKGILVKYPKRKPPTRGKKKTNQAEGSPSNRTLPSRIQEKEAPPHVKVNNQNTFSNLNNCRNIDNSFAENHEDISKLFDGQDMPNTSQIIDFFEPNSSRSLTDAGNQNEFERSFTNISTSCSLISERSKQLNDKEPAVSIRENTKSMAYVPSISSITSATNTNVSVNGKDLSYMTSIPLISSSLSSDCSSLKHLSNADCSGANNGSRQENHVNSNNKNSEKVLTPLSIQCTMSEGVKSASKDLQLTFDDKHKNYEPSFDELLTSLQVQSGSHSADSISPTATFLLNFPIVSSSKNVDTEQEEDSNAETTTSTTILQIGNMGSPTTLLFTNKNSKQTEKDENFTYQGHQNLNQASNQEKKKDCKESGKDFFSLDIFSSNPVKSSCSKEPSVAAPNVTFYPTSTTSNFPSYNMFTKYNEIPAVTSSYYSFGSQSFPPVTKTVGPIGDFNSWMPSLCITEDTSKEKKEDKDRSTQNTFDLSAETPEKKKKTKQNSRPLVNWMTSPDLRTLPETSKTFNDVFVQSKDDNVNVNAYFNVPNVQNNANFATTYSSSDYYLDTQAFADSQLSNCKITYSETPATYSWSPSKSSLPSTSLDTNNMTLTSTLPTLVGDLALGNQSATYESPTKKYEAEKKKETCKNYYRNQSQNASSFLSVTQLVDNNKEVTNNKHIPSKKTDNYPFENRDKCFKENYYTNKANENSKNNFPSNSCKELPKNQVKCRKENLNKRCLSKENKKERLPQKSFNDYSLSNCLMNKEVNPLTNKNSNYSAESLISTNTQSNSCSSQNYLSYDNNNMDFTNCSTNKRPEEVVDSVTNVGYYSNSNYVYPNNFQTFNNYSFSNQYCNHYSSQIQTNELQKKKEDCLPNKTDSDWYKEGYSAYGTIGSNEFTSNQKDKNKQTFSNRCNNGQRSSTINSGMYNSYYQYSTSGAVFNSKSDCNFNTTYSFSQTNQTFSNTNNCQTSMYNNNKSNRTATSFNMSAIFPEINNKHCAASSRIHSLSNEKNDPKYNSNKVTMDNMNYNYMNQPATENNVDIPPVYGSSSFQISQFADFSQRKPLK